jgi:hypothetical protein
MLCILSLAEAILYCFIFMAAVTFSNIFIEHSKLSHRNFTKDQAPKIKIFVLMLVTIFLMSLTYFNHCYNKSEVSGILQCMYINQGKLMLYFRGHFHGPEHWCSYFYKYHVVFGWAASRGLCNYFYIKNGEIKRKFLRFYKREFQWDLFKKLFIVPLCVEIIYRAIICRVIDPKI